MKTDDGLPRSDGDMSVKGEGQPERNGCMVNVFEEWLDKMGTR
jgi:hypothetical protein